MERDNFYILLELAFDPPVTDEEVIREALRRKKQEWTRMQDNPSRRAEALRNLGLAHEMETVMLDGDQRIREAEKAQRLRDSMIRRFEAELRLLEGKGHLLPAEASAILIKYKAYGITGETLEEYAAVPVSEEPPAPEGDGEGEMIDRVLADNIQRHLTALGYPDLYAFLGEVPYASLKKLRATAETRRREAVAVGNAIQATLTQELAGICMGVFESFDSKQKYDRYRRISLYPELNRLVDEELLRSHYISPSALIRLVNYGVETFGGKVLDMEDYIRRYCAAMGYPVDVRSLEIACPCCGNKTERDGGACTACGAPLQGSCPGCGAPFEGGVEACGECGFAIGKMGKALEYITEAETALIDNNWSTAERTLLYIKKHWPGHPKIELLEKRTALLAERYARYVDSIRDSVEHNQYYAALELIEEARARRIRLPSATVSHVEGAVADLEAAVAKLLAGGKEPPFSELYKLSTRVADSMDLNRLMAQYPPEAPEKIAVQAKGRNVYLAWTPSPSSGNNHYVVVRKTGAPPLTAFDGEVLYEGPAGSYIDRSVPPLLRHYYGVYTRRGISYSKEGKVSEAVQIIPQIENLRITPADMGAQLTWDFNPDIREVQIWRKLGGERPSGPEDGILLETSRLDGYTDTKIKNDVEYWYYLVAVYLVEGKAIRAKGVCESVTPHKIIAPIEQLDVAKVDGTSDEYVVNWHSADYAPGTDVLLLASQKPPQYRVGAIIPVSELMERFRRLDLEHRQGDGARFRHRFSGGIYIVAAAVYGKFATVGRPRYVVNVSPPREITWDVAGGNLYLNMKWPPGVEQVAVAYRFDGYPVRPDDPAATVLNCTKGQYEYDAGVLLREPEATVYYATVYAVFQSPEEGITYSNGVQVKIDNTGRQEIAYKVDYSKRLFSRQGKLVLTVEAQEDLALPPAVLMGKIGRMPLQQSDGMPLVTLEKELRVQGAISMEYQTDSLPKDLYVRLFLRDEGQYEQYGLLPAFHMKLT